MRKREVYRLERHRGRNIYSWFQQLNTLIADFIYCWVEDEEDLVGASHVANFLSWFYGRHISYRCVIKVWKLIQSGRFNSEISVGEILSKKKL